MSTLVLGGAPSVIVFSVVSEFSTPWPPVVRLPSAAGMPPVPRAPPVALRPPGLFSAGPWVEPHPIAAAQSAEATRSAALFPFDIGRHLDAFLARPHPERLR